MGDRHPESLWDLLRRTLRGWMDDEDAASDPDYVFHLPFIAPIFLGIVSLLRKA